MAENLALFPEDTHLEKITSTGVCCWICPEEEMEIRGLSHGLLIYSGKR